MLPRAAIGDALNGLLAQLGEAAGGDVQVPAYRLDRMRVWLERGHGQGAAIAVAALTGTRQLSVYRDAAAVVRRAAPAPFHQTLELQLDRGRWLVAHVRGAPPAPLPPAPKPSPELLRATAKAFAGVRLADVASQVGLNFRQDDFRFGTSYDVHSMMGGGLCWLDYNNDGWMDLFVVNSYSDADAQTWNAHGGLPRSALFENVHGHFVNVSARSHADPAVQGNGCVAADFNGDGYTDLLVTTNTYNVLLWNNGNGTFTDGTHAAGIDAFGTYGWHTGATVADVNGDGRPDIFVSGYADVNAPSQNSSGGFPLNFQAFRDLLYLNEGTDSHGHSRFKEVSLRGGHRGASRRPQPRRRVHRRERRRPARPLRRERPRPEPPLHQRARRAARLPLRRGGALPGSRGPEGRDGCRRPGLLGRRPSGHLRDELPWPGARGLPLDRGGGVLERPVHVRARGRAGRDRLGGFMGRSRERRPARPRARERRHSGHEPEAGRGAGPGDREPRAAASPTRAAPSAFGPGRS